MEKEPDGFVQFKGINIPDLPDLTFGGSLSGSTSAYPGSRSPEEIYEEIQKSMEYLDSLRPMIYIWSGSSTPYGNRSEPILHYSELIQDTNAAYLVAGFGIVAGWKAYDFLTSIGIKLKWSDSFIPLEEQEDYCKFKDILNEY